MKVLYLFYFICAFLFLTSCSEKEDLSPAKEKEDIIISGKKYDEFIKNKLKGSRTMVYTEHGPFAFGSSGTLEIPGPSGSLKVWQLFLSGFSGYSDGTYFCRYYEDAGYITFPPGQYLIANSVAAANPGFTGNQPENPISLTGSETGATFEYNTVTNQYKFKTHFLLPKYNLSGQDVNPNNVRVPHQYAIAYLYKYFTLE